MKNILLILLSAFFLVSCGTLTNEPSESRKHYGKKFGKSKVCKLKGNKFCRYKKCFNIRNIKKKNPEVVKKVKHIREAREKKSGLPEVQRQALEKELKELKAGQLKERQEQREEVRKELRELKTRQVEKYKKKLDAVLNIYRKYGLIQ